MIKICILLNCSESTIDYFFKNKIVAKNLSEFLLKTISTKFWQIGVPTRDSFSSCLFKVCNLGRVEARYWKPKIVFSRSTNTSPVRTRWNIIIHTRILIHVMTFFSRNAYKRQILKFWFEYYSSRVITPNSAWYPSNSWIPSFFWVAKQGRVIRRNLIFTKIFHFFWNDHVSFNKYVWLCIFLSLSLCLSVVP